ncbi:secretion protein HlyD [Kineococcus sp. T13]|uniref:efflux RND transporter periplasmic adaptor subunit n=1 Tax=Kineococcus vitellinus TaxID=2696565 RepID=UPI001411C308|nr:efflux RND transporter periplasmic adaptor subunit [Kineococcus vitellinus]NAZ77322.1 secretion protein HlyD [Kineococcus vitellinus]
MGVFRTIVFPALRLLVWALIAVALLWLAFGRAGREEADAAASPYAVVDPPAVPVTRGDVVNTVSLQGSIQADPATTVKSTATGTVGKLRAEVGQVVEKGDPLFTVLVPVEEPPAAPAAAPVDPAAPAPAPAAPRTRTVVVSASAPGTLATLDVLPQQEVTVGTAVATLSPGTLTVSAPLTQAQQFRLLAPPSTAQVTVPGGPGTFECTGLRTGSPATAAPAAPDPTGGYVDPYADPSSSMTGATVSCAVPAGVQVFAGLSATVDVTAGSATGVLLAPVTAVRGSVGTGTVWVVGEDGSPVETDVTLGLTDGANVEVVQGLVEGAQVLQFVPGTDTPTDAAGGGTYGMGY